MPNDQNSGNTTFINELFAGMGGGTPSVVPANGNIVLPPAPEADFEISDEDIIALQNKTLGGTKPPDPADPDDDDDDDDDASDGESQTDPAKGNPAATAKPKPPTPADKSKPNPDPAQDTSDPDGLNVLSKTLVQQLVETGNWEDDEEDEPVASVEDLIERLPKQAHKLASKEINARFESAFKNNPSGKEKGTILFDHLVRGGDVDSFLAIYSGDSINTDLLESKEEGVAENVAKRVLTDYYTRVAGWDAETLSKQFARWEKLGSFVDEAIVVSTPYNNFRKKAKEEFVNSSAENEKKLNEKNIQLGNAVNDIIMKSAEFSGYEIGAKKSQKQKVQDYIYKPVVKLESGAIVSQYVADKMKQQGTPEWVLFEALSMMNNKTPTKIIEQTSSNQNKTLRDKLREGIGKRPADDQQIQQQAAGNNQNQGNRSVAQLFGVDITNKDRRYV